jgi:integrase
MRSRTVYYYTRLCLSFDTFRRHHEGRPFEEVAGAWVQTLSVSQQSVARAALRWRYPDAMDWRRLRVARYRRDEARLLASLLRPPQRARVRALATTPRDRALLECLWTMRRGEAAGLQWGDIDLGPGMAYIRHGKGGASGVVPLAPAAPAALADWYVASGCPADATPVFPGRHGRPMTAQGLGVATRRVLRRAGLWTPGSGAAHRFRRTMATEYLRANRHDLEGLRRIMRHAHITTTLRYVFLEPEDLTQSFAKLVL